MKLKEFTKQLLLPAAAFLLIFSIIFSIVTLVFYPKWSPDESGGQMAGFYKEPENTIDVIFLGSCNMYTTISPVLMYEEYGITGYAFTCPDQELSTSYYYIKEALKTQKPKAIVLESLFFTYYNTEKRERYNRYALDYMPMSIDKIAMAAELSGRESEFMQKYDATTPDRLLTFAGYMFPLLRYHTRTDLSKEDVTFFLSDNLYHTHKGNHVQYSLPLTDDFCKDIPRARNGHSINEIAKEYFPKIRQLCEENEIPLVVIKSPNYMRWGWDDSITSIVRDYVEGQDVRFIDFHAAPYNNFIPEDYNQSTTMNIYGDKKLTHTLGGYLVEELGLTPTPLSEQDAAQWAFCVEDFYADAKAAGADITPGQIGYITNLDGAASVRWNECGDSNTYSVYRSIGHTANFEKVADISGSTYDDTDVVSGQGYSYYIVPNEGEKEGQVSEVKYNIYLSMPENYTIANENGAVRLNWEAVAGADYYHFYRRTNNDYIYTSWVKPEKTTNLSTQVENGNLYFYRLTAVKEEDGVAYHSESEILPVIPQVTPVITSARSEKSGITIQWERLKNQSEIQIWRRSEEQEEFALYDVVGGKETSYTNKNYTEAGKSYTYKIVSVANKYDVTAESAASNEVTVTAIG